MKRRAFLKTLMAAFTCNWIPAIALADAPMTHLPSRRIHKGASLRQTEARQKNFKLNNQGDIVLAPADYALLHSSAKRLARLQLSIGHGNFALLGFDDALAHARHVPSVDSFTTAELDFMEKIFHQDARLYGFMGGKPITRITDHVKTHDFVRVPATGNFLFMGQSLETYQRMSRDVGNELILTSGIRGVAKQFYLFFRKAVRTNGNLSLASRSLAPPGYSFHGIGDFDVGSVGLGIDNFTRHFTKTDVFKKLQDLDYVRLRYTESNRLGVRFEPWHIKVIT